MKFLFTICLLLSYSLILLSQEKDYIITGSIKKYPSRAMAYLFYKGPNGRLVDSVEIEKGSFTFRGKIDEPRPASIVLKKAGKNTLADSYITFYIEPGELSLTSNSMMYAATITGSPASLELQELDKLGVNVILRRPDSVSVTRTTLQPPAPTGAGYTGGVVKEGSSKPVTTTQFPGIEIITIDQLPQEMQITIRNWEVAAKDKVLQFIKDHPRSFVSLYTLYKLWVYKKISSDEYHNMLNVLDPTLLQSNEGKVMFAGTIDPK